MRFVLTLIAAGRDRRLREFAAALGRELPVLGAPVWLANDEACDIFLVTTDAERVERFARGLIGAAPVDIIVQPADGRRKKLLVADLESTVIENEMLDEMGAALALGPRIAEITRRAMNGEVDFADALAARVALLAGAERRLIAECAARIRLTPGAHTLVATMRRAGARTALVTSGFMVFAERVAAELGFERVIANHLEIADDRLTGRVLPPIIDAAAKRRALLAIAAEFDIAPAATLALGDGANDLPMLAVAGLGVAFRPKPAVAAAVRTRLVFADLTGVLYAQGFRKAEFAG